MFLVQEIYFVKEGNLLDTQFRVRLPENKFCTKNANFTQNGFVDFCFLFLNTNTHTHKHNCILRLIHRT